MPAPAAEPCTLDSEIFGMRRIDLDEGVIVLQSSPTTGVTVSASAAAPIVCRSPPAEKARPSPSKDQRP